MKGSPPPLARVTQLFALTGICCMRFSSWVILYLGKHVKYSFCNFEKKTVLIYSSCSQNRKSVLYSESSDFAEATCSIRKPAFITTWYFPLWTIVHSSKDTSAYLHIQVHSGTSHNNWKVESVRCLWTEEWISKMWSGPATEYHSARKKQDVLTHPQQGRPLRTLCSGKQARHKRTSLWAPGVVKLTKTEHRVAVAGGWGQGGMGVTVQWG